MVWTERQWAAMTDTPDWQPSEAMRRIAGDAAHKHRVDWDDWPDWEAALIAVRPLMKKEILDDEKPKIEAAERERIAQYLEDFWPEYLEGKMIASPRAAAIRALKDSKP